MKKAGVIAVFLIFIFAQPVLAHSGCCSYHGGVMSNGCGCNDGTPLSSTCAPYYACTAKIQTTTQIQPASSNSTHSTLVARGETPYPIVVSFTPTPSPTIVPAPTIQPTPHISPKPTPKPKLKIIKHHRTFWDWLFGVNK